VPQWPRIAEKLPHHHLNAVQDVWGRQRQLISDGGIILSVLGPEFANSKGQSSVGAGFEQSVGFSGVDSKRSPKTISGQSMLSLEDHINLLLTFWRVKWPGWKGVFAFRGEICCLGRGMAGMWTLRTTSQKSTCIHPDIVSRELVARQDRYADRGESHVRQFASGERKYQASLTSCSPGGRLVFCELLSCGSDWAAPLGRIRGRLWALFPTREQAEDPCSLDRCRSIDHQGNNLLAQQVCSAIIQTCNCFGHHNRKRRNFSVTCAQLFADYVVFLQSPDASQMLLVSFCCAFACLGALLFGYGEPHRFLPDLGALIATLESNGIFEHTLCCCAYSLVSRLIADMSCVFNEQILGSSPLRLPRQTLSTISEVELWRTIQQAE
jgi:hypothetical protein